MLSGGVVLAGLAAALHVYIFFMESLAWTKPSTRAVFGTSAEEAETTKELAYNQGFYNLFLAVIAACGIFHVAADRHAEAGWALLLASTATMLAAAVVLRSCGKGYTRAAATQGLFPLLAVVFGVLALT